MVSVYVSTQSITISGYVWKLGSMASKFNGYPSHGYGATVQTWIIEAQLDVSSVTHRLPR